MPVEYTLDGQAGVKDQEMSRELKANVGWLKEYLGYKETFDLIVREFKIGSRQVALVYLDSFVAQTDLTLIMEELFNTPDDQLTSPSLRGLLNRKVPYIKDIANDYFVRQIRQRIKDINVDALTMSEKAVQEWIMHKPWWNPFPNSRFTERPDVAAEHLTEGHVLVMIDTSPNAMILPVSVFSFLQSAEEYHEDVLIGTYLKWVRILGVALSWLLPPLWYALVVSHVSLDGGWKVLVHPSATDIPIFWQLVGAEVGVDLLRLALTFSPNPLTQSMGFFGAVLLGDIAVKAKLLDAQAMVFVALAAVGTFTAPDIDFGMAVRLLRMFLLLFTGFGKLVGLVWGGFSAGIVLPLIVLVATDSFGMRYSWPVYPWDGSALGSEFIRKPLNRKFMRPSITLPVDRTHRRPKS